MASPSRNPPADHTSKAGASDPAPPNGSVPFPAGDFLADANLDAELDRIIGSITGLPDTSPIDMDVDIDQILKNTLGDFGTPNLFDRDGAPPSLSTGPAGQPVIPTPSLSAAVPVCPTTPPLPPPSAASLTSPEPFAVDSLGLLPTSFSPRSGASLNSLLASMEMESVRTAAGFPGKTIAEPAPPLPPVLTASPALQPTQGPSSVRPGPVGVPDLPGSLPPHISAHAAAPTTPTPAPRTRPPTTSVTALEVARRMATAAAQAQRPAGFSGAADLRPVSTAVPQSPHGQPLAAPAPELPLGYPPDPTTGRPGAGLGDFIQELNSNVFLGSVLQHLEPIRRQLLIGLFVSLNHGQITQTAFIERVHALLGTGLIELLNKWREKASGGLTASMVNAPPPTEDGAATLAPTAVPTPPEPEPKPKPKPKPRAKPRPKPKPKATDTPAKDGESPATPTTPSTVGPAPAPADSVAAPITPAETTEPSRKRPHKESTQGSDAEGSETPAKPAPKPRSKARTKTSIKEDARKKLAADENKDGSPLPTDPATAPATPAPSTPATSAATEGATSGAGDAPPSSPALAPAPTPRPRGRQVGSNKKQKTSHALGRSGSTDPAAGEAKAAGNEAPSQDKTDFDPLSDVMGYAGFDLTEESESMFRDPGLAVEDFPNRSKTQSFLDPVLLQRTVSAIVAQNRLAGVDPDTLAYIALATQDRLRGLIDQMIQASKHRTRSHVLAPPPTNDQGVPLYRIIIHQDVRKQLMALERVDREEERRRKIGALERHKRLHDAMDGGSAKAGGGTGSSTGGGGVGSPAIATAEGNASGSRESTPADPEGRAGSEPPATPQSNGASSKPQRRKRREPGTGPLSVARSVSEDIRKKITNQTALLSAGGITKSWMRMGSAAAAAATTPTPSERVRARAGSTAGDKLMDVQDTEVKSATPDADAFTTTSDAAAREVPLARSVSFTVPEGTSAAASAATRVGDTRSSAEPETPTRPLKVPGSTAAGGGSATSSLRTSLWGGASKGASRTPGTAASPSGGASLLRRPIRTGLSSAPVRRHLNAGKGLASPFAPSSISSPHIAGVVTVRDALFCLERERAGYGGQNGINAIAGCCGERVMLKLYHKYLKD
ncbi:hypothetical protein IWQ60_005345 [Tieghemiomyces parasiticus]|uniref:Transcription initiation factor TFIID subunit 4 n=1 Tax=Tieghemiomyces parasiticus TaxID=78921 RepID=A0A9W8A6H2_9FUNG|nr:hypothetical protein IWQ60_005345 [Tieghemiomyces parasiticus]